MAAPVPAGAGRAARRRAVRPAARPAGAHRVGAGRPGRQRGTDRLGTDDQRAARLAPTRSRGGRVTTPRAAAAAGAAARRPTGGRCWWKCGTGSPPRRCPARSATDGETGRGLLMVEAVSSRWGYYYPARQPAGHRAGRAGRQGRLGPSSRPGAMNRGAGALSTLRPGAVRARPAPRSSGPRRPGPGPARRGCSPAGPRCRRWPGPGHARSAPAPCRSPAASAPAGRSRTSGTAAGSSGLNSRARSCSPEE